MGTPKIPLCINCQWLNGKDCHAVVDPYNGDMPERVEVQRLVRRWWTYLEARGDKNECGHDGRYFQDKNKSLKKGSRR